MVQHHNITERKWSTHLVPEKFPDDLFRAPLPVEIPNALYERRRLVVVHRHEHELLHTRVCSRLALGCTAVRDIGAAQK